MGTHLGQTIRSQTRMRRVSLKENNVCYVNLLQFFCCSSRSINYQRRPMWVCWGKKHKTRCYCERQARVREYWSRVAARQRAELSEYRQTYKWEAAVDYKSPLVVCVCIDLVGKKISTPLQFTYHWTRCDPLITSPQPSWSQLNALPQSVELSYVFAPTWEENNVNEREEGLRMHGACQSWTGSKDVEWSYERQKQHAAVIPTAQGIMWGQKCGHSPALTRSHTKLNKCLLKR